MTIETKLWKRGFDGEVGMRPQFSFLIIVPKNHLMAEARLTFEDIPPNRSPHWERFKGLTSDANRCFLGSHRSRLYQKASAWHEIKPGYQLGLSDEYCGAFVFEMVGEGRIYHEHRTGTPLEKEAFIDETCRRLKEYFDCLTVDDVEATVLKNAVSNLKVLGYRGSASVLKRYIENNNAIRERIVLDRNRQR